MHADTVIAVLMLGPFAAFMTWQAVSAARDVRRTNARLRAAVDDTNAWTDTLTDEVKRLRVENEKLREERDRLMAGGAYR